MNGTVAELAARQLLSGRRVLLLAVLPVVLVALAVIVRLVADGDRVVATDLLATFALGVVVPLLGLVAGIGVIGGEVDDGSIVYLLTKPLSRHAIATSKILVAGAVAVAAAALPTWAAAVIMGLDVQLAAGFALAAAPAALAYAALVVALAVVTRAAVPIGLLYVLVWEGIVGGFVPGARALSIRQWAAGVADAALGDRSFEAGLDPAVGGWTGGILLLLVVVVTTWYAGRRLDRLRVSAEG